MRTRGFHVPGTHKVSAKVSNKSNASDSARNPIQHWSCTRTPRVSVERNTFLMVLVSNGARAGSRTLNLGIKRLRARSVRECQRVSGNANRARGYDAAATTTQGNYSVQRFLLGPVVADFADIESTSLRDRFQLATVREARGAPWPPMGHGLYSLPARIALAESFARLLAVVDGLCST